MSFSRNWNDAYMAIPTDDDDAREGAARIRDLKNDIMERMSIDHSWEGDVFDGRHRQVGLVPLDADPAAISGIGFIYVKKQGSIVELYYRDDSGQVFPLTSAAGGLANIMLPGMVVPFAGGTFGAALAGDTYILCNGQAVSRTDFAGLFFALGTGWGAGNGSTTFNVPDLRGRTVIGSGTGVGLTARTVAQIMGEEKHRLTIQEIPGHSHNIDRLQSAGAAGAGGTGGLSAQSVTTTDGYSPTYSAGGNAGTGIAELHENMQPSAVIHWVVKT